ncbi:YoaK family protein [Haloferula chungangensis]|uniref:YoaK family protein n=1 Tax=Haloferula chungangensis TaxID=1048331 RepID=A0ABW2L964_9BACT
MQQFSTKQLVLGGCLLAFGASFLNTGFILNTGTSVSHLTGDISRIGSGFWTSVKGDGSGVAGVVAATLGFVFGAAISGFLLHHPTLEITRPYGRILSVLGLFLVGAHFVQHQFPIMGIVVVSAVCGSQNALASRYRGMVLRTTHLTGLFTDFGIHIGMKLRGHHIESWKLVVPICVACSFLLGAIACSALVFHQSAHWILMMGAAYFSGGVIWSIWKRSKGNKVP